MRLQKMSLYGVGLAVMIAFSGCSSWERQDIEQPVAPSESSSAQTQEQPSSGSSIDIPDDPADWEDIEVAPAVAMLPQEEEAFADFYDLDAEKKGWGPGGPVDEQNRSVGALSYNDVYSAYDAMFINEQSDDIYLTFDLGYENGYTPVILDAMAEREAKGVFFITGGYLRTQPDLVQRIIDEGHVLGNHSDNHPDMTTLPLSEVYADTLALHNMVVEQYDYEMELYRFPEGSFNEQVLALMQDSGYRSVFWSFAYRDWEVDNQPDPQESLTQILDKAHPGAVYLLHAVSSTNAEIMVQVIDGMIEKGFEIGDPWDLVG